MKERITDYIEGHDILKYALGKHYKLERIIAILVSVSLAMCALLMNINIKHINDTKITLSDVALYTTNFTTSMTRNTGSVLNVYTNEEYNKGFILLKFNDMDSMPVDANQYRVFLTGSSINASPTRLEMNPSGSVYMFGSTGYMGIYLSEALGFDKQILEITVRSHEKLAETVEVDTSQYRYDETFATYDQFRFYVNLGAVQTEKSDLLSDAEGMKLDKIYYEFVAQDQETKLKDTYQSTIDSMVVELDKIKEYSSRLSSVGMVVPETPSIISGDSYELNDNDTEDDSTDDYNTIVTEHINPGGYWFDIYGGNCYDGYLTDDELLGMSYQDYVKTVDQEAVIEYESSGVRVVKDYIDSRTNDVVFNTATLPWIMKDTGESFDSTVSSEWNDESTIASDKSNLISSWASYNSMKSNLQKNVLRSLMVLTGNVENANFNFTINDSDTALVNYDSLN